MTLPILILLSTKVTLIESTEVGKICLVSCLFSNLVFKIVYTLKGIFIHVENYNQAQATGPVAFFAALVLCLMQQDPEASYVILPNVSIRSSMLPASLMSAALFLSLAEQSFAPLVLAFSGILAAYWYMRYMKIVDGRRGDRSIAMSFTAMFPAILRPLGIFLASKGHDWACRADRWNIIRDWQSDLEIQDVGRLSPTEIERRRTMALQILNEKMIAKREAIAAAKPRHDESPNEADQPITERQENILQMDTTRPMASQLA
jgi:hypothetical protein